MTPKELAVRAGLSDQAITSRIRAGQLGAARESHGGSYRYLISPEDCNTFLSERGLLGGRATRLDAAHTEIERLREDLITEREAHERTRDQLAVARAEASKHRESARRLNQALLQQSAHTSLEAVSAALQQYLVPDTLND